MVNHIEKIKPEKKEKKLKVKPGKQKEEESNKRKHPIVRKDELNGTTENQKDKRREKQKNDYPDREHRKYKNHRDGCMHVHKQMLSETVNITKQVSNTPVKH